MSKKETKEVPEKISLTDKQIKTIQILEQLIHHQISNAVAAKRLGLTKRQIIRKKQAYLEHGVSSLVHGNSKVGRALFNTSITVSYTVPEEVDEFLVALYKNEYNGWNFNHFKDMLLDEYDISFSYTFLYKLLVKNGIKSPQKQKKAKKAHPPRKRKEYAGDLVQVDASNHVWIILNGRKYYLHGAIDDATGIVLSLILMEQEVILGYQLVLKDIMQGYGIPRCLYTDYRTIFKSNHRLSMEEITAGKQTHDTRFATMCKRHGIEITSTMVPQAKGRIERLWKTLQDRLVKELEKANITTKRDANNYIKNIFLPRYNAGFASPLKYSKNHFIPVPEDFDFNRELALQDIRTVINHSYISYHGTFYRLYSKQDPNEPVYIHGNPQIVIYILLDNTIEAKYKNKWYILREIAKQEVYPSKEGSEKQTNTLNQAELNQKRSEYAKTNKNSPWRKHFDHPKH